MPAAGLTVRLNLVSIITTNMIIRLAVTVATFTIIVVTSIIANKKVDIASLAIAGHCYIILHIITFPNFIHSNNFNFRIHLNQALDMD